MKFFNKIFCTFLFLLIFACSSKILKYENADSLKKNNEFEAQVVIVKPELPAESSELQKDELGSQNKAEKENEKSSKNVGEVHRLDEVTKAQRGNQKLEPKSVLSAGKKKRKKLNEKQPELGESGAEKSTNGTTATVTSAHREPDIEDTVGFNGRRPIVEPVRVGEIIKMSVRYFKLNAGILNLKVEPFSVVNGKKSYTFVTEVKSASFFSNIYTADDRVESFVDYETLVPHTYSLHVKESGQLREAQCFFDHTKNHATFWEKKYTEKNGHEERKQSWDILPYSQNVFSAIFYMRFFKWEVGKEIAFRVAHDEENIVFRGKAIRQEKLETEAGTFDAIVIKPEFQVKGAFKPVGEILFWVSNDDRRYILRVESSIKIGTLVAEAIEIVPGK